MVLPKGNGLPGVELNDDDIGVMDDYDLFDNTSVGYLDPLSALEMGDAVWEASSAADRPDYSDS